MAEQVRRSHEVPPAAALTAVTKRYIELAQRPPLEPGPVRDVLVWIAHFQQGIAWVELAIEDLTGRVVRREQSR